jgi:hypothetical protein
MSDAERDRIYHRRLHIERLGQTWGFRSSWPLLPPSGYHSSSTTRVFPIMLFKLATLSAQLKRIVHYLNWTEAMFGYSKGTTKRY